MTNETETNTATTQISDSKLEANRLNAQKSTGPKTAMGKSKSRWNALKHGLRAKEVIVPTPDNGETIGAFEELVAQLQEELKPEGIIEEMLVEKIALCYWRRRRAVRCEAGEVRKKIGITNRVEAINGIQLVRQCKLKIFSPEIISYEMKHASAGLKYLISVVESAIAHFNAVGFTSKEWLEKLTRAYIDDQDSFVFVCTLLWQDESTVLSEDERASNKALSQKWRRWYKKKMLNHMNSKLTELQTLLKGVEKREQTEREARLISFTIPVKDIMDKILRYETAIDREMYRAIDELRHLQRQRKGATALPQIQANIPDQN